MYASRCVQVRGFVRDDLVATRRWGFWTLTGVRVAA